MQAQQCKNIKDTKTKIMKSRKETNTLKSLYDILPLIIYVFYPIQLLYLLFKDGFTLGIQSESLLRFSIIPIVSIILLFAIRKIIKRSITNSTGISNPTVKYYPSVNTASAFVIALAFMYISVQLGIVMLSIALIIGVTRVLSGAHKIREVITGSLLGIIIGVLGFFVL